MSVTQREKECVRELAKKYMSLICTEKQEKTFQRFRDTNDLKQGRPPVLIGEIPWYQMDIDGELTCFCENEGARMAERHFREALFYMKHFKADNHFEPFFQVKRSVDSIVICILIIPYYHKKVNRTARVSQAAPNHF